MEGANTTLTTNSKFHFEVIEKVKLKLKCDMPLCDRYPRYFLKNRRLINGKSNTNIYSGNFIDFNSLITPTKKNCLA